MAAASATIQAEERLQQLSDAAEGQRRTVEGLQRDAANAMIDAGKVPPALLAQVSEAKAMHETLNGACAQAQERLDVARAADVQATFERERAAVRETLAKRREAAREVSALLRQLAPAVQEMHQAELKLRFLTGGSKQALTDEGWIASEVLGTIATDDTVQHRLSTQLFKLLGGLWKYDRTAPGPFDIFESMAGDEAEVLAVFDVLRQPKGQPLAQG